MFITNGMALANVLPRYPEIKASLDLSNTGLGVAVAMLPVGSIVFGLAAAHLMRKWGSASVATVCMIVYSLLLIGIGFVPNVVVFGLIMMIAGGIDAIADSGQNAHGMRVQRAYGRSIINSFHAMWSVGAVTGGLMAAGAIALGLPLWIHLSISAAIICALAIVAKRMALPGPDREPVEAGTGPAVSRISTKIIILVIAFGLISVAGSFVEDIGNSWATLYMATEIGAPEALAAFGFISLAGAQFLGRLVGDRLVDRFGDLVVAQAGAVLVGGGILLAIFVQHPATTLLGFAMAGFGIATWCPTAFAYADNLPGLKEGTGIMMVSWIMRIGFLVSPPLVGAIADATSLRMGMWTVPIAAAFAFICAYGFREQAPESESADRY